MRLTLLFIFTLLSLEAVAQWKVTGKVLNKNGKAFKNVEVVEDGTKNNTITNRKGAFELVTTRDSASVGFYTYVLSSVQRILVTSDTTITIKLDFIDFYNTRWLSLGSNYDPINKVFGLHLSNGVDELPIIHFEDFQDIFLIKANAQSDFDNNHSFGLELGVNYLRFAGRTTIQYNYINFKSSQLLLNGLNLTSQLRYIGSTGLIFRTGYQHYDNKGRYGLGMGLIRSIGKIHVGANSRYYFDYFHHEAYLMVRITKSRMFNLRVVYNRIDHHDLLTFGLNYAFIRNR
ncbi:MAG: hypothetical protein Roseis3KO_33480 [Roseivirga sp.]